MSARRRLTEYAFQRARLFRTQSGKRHQWHALQRYHKTQLCFPTITSRAIPPRPRRPHHYRSRRPVVLCCAARYAATPSAEEPRRYATCRCETGEAGRSDERQERAADDMMLPSSPYGRTGRRSASEGQRQATTAGRALRSRHESPGQPPRFSSAGAIGDDAGRY